LQGALHTNQSCCYWFQYWYNYDGSLSGEYYPTGTYLAHYYDAAGRQWSFYDWYRNWGVKAIDTFYPNGAMQYGREAIDLNTNVNHVYLLDTLNNRLQLSTRAASGYNSTTNTYVTAQQLSYDYASGTANNGNINVTNNYKDTTRSQSYSYDYLNRLTHAWSTNGSAWDINYTLDAWGNMTTRGPGGGFTNSPAPDNFSNSIDTNNRLVSQMSYDSAGNVLSDGTNQYRYNGNNQVVTYNNSSSPNYEYDVDGKRVQKSGTYNDRVYYYGVSGVPAVETDLSGNIKTEYYFFNGQRVG